VNRANLFGIRAGQTEADAAVVVRSDISKGLRLGAKHVEASRRTAIVGAGRRVEMKLDNAIRIRVGEGLKEYRIDDGKYRGGRVDS
jgi:hypothetical protein